MWYHIRHLCNRPKHPDVTGFSSYETNSSGKAKHTGTDTCESLYVFVCGWGRKWWVGYLLYAQPGVFTNSSVSFPVAQHIYFPQWLKWWVQTGPLPSSQHRFFHVSVTPPWQLQRVLSVEHSRSVKAGLVASGAAGVGIRLKGSNTQSGRSMWTSSKHTGCTEIAQNQPAISALHAMARSHGYPAAGCNFVIS